MARIAAFLTSLLALYQRLHLFVGRDIWRTDLAATSRLGAIGIYPLRVVLIVIRGFWLEHQGLLSSEWGTSDNNRRAKFYTLTAGGRRRLREGTDSWNRLAAAMSSALKSRPSES